MFRAARLTAILASLALLEAGCRQPPEKRPASEVLSVRSRIGGRQFAQPTSLRTIAQIGDEARAVVAAPTQILVAEVVGAEIVAGTARATVMLPKESFDLPDSAFVLSFQDLPKVVTVLPTVADDFARWRAFRSAVEGFKLVRNAKTPGQATIEYTPTSPLESPRINLHLHALLPMTVDLESDEFTPSPGSRIELGFGLVQQPGAMVDPRVEFRATLACTGEPDSEVVTRTLEPSKGGAEGWYDVSSALPAGGRCRLRLAAKSETDDDVRGAVWSIPRIVAPMTGATAPDVQSVILISLDTLRADHLSGYGYPRDTSPRIDAGLIEQGTAFTDVSTTFPRTDVAHMSLLTSLYAEAQPEPGNLPAGSDVVTLAEALRDAGFETAAFTEDGLVAGAFGFWFGFDRFVERSFDERHRGVKTFADAARYVEENRDRRFFLFLHTYKTHEPYVSDEHFHALFDGQDDALSDRRVPDQHRPEVDAYDRTIREADVLVDGLLAALERLGLADRTLVVLLSDHGEAFGEHGIARHGLAFHQEQLRIPLVFRGPGVPEGERVTAAASLVDVAPTVLDLVGLPPLPASQGISLAPAFAGKRLARQRPLFFSWMGAPGCVGMRYGDLKLARAAGKYQLFDLAKDPQEITPRVPTAAEIELLDPHIDGHVDASAQRRKTIAASAPAAGQPAGIPERVEESLRALGYL